MTRLILEDHGLAELVPPSGGHPRRGLTRPDGSVVIGSLKRFTSSIAATLLVLFLGVHWFALQSVGWASMLVVRSQTTTWTDAVRTTFDGQHPCEVCKVVAAGRAAEKKPSIAFKVTKLEVALTADELSMPPVPPVRRARILDPVILTEDRSIPLLPPPRRS